MTIKYYGCSDSELVFKSNCRYSVNIWKEVEQQIRTRYRVNVTLTYHNVIMGFRQEMYANHAAINTIIMAMKKRIC